MRGGMRLRIASKNMRKITAKYQNLSRLKPTHGISRNKRAAAREDVTHLNFGMLVKFVVK